MTTTWEKRLVIDGNVIRKSVVGESTFNFMKAQQVEITKLKDRDAVSVIEKRVTTSLPQIGKAADIAGLLHRIEKSGKDGSAIAKDVEKVFDGLNELITKGGAAIFKERGSSQGCWQQRRGRRPHRGVGRHRQADARRRQSQEHFQGPHHGARPAPGNRQARGRISQGTHQGGLTNRSIFSPRRGDAGRP